MVADPARTVLACMLVDGADPSLAESQDFAVPALRVIYDALVRLGTHGRPDIGALTRLLLKEPNPAWQSELPNLPEYLCHRNNLETNLRALQRERQIRELQCEAAKALDAATNQRDPELVLTAARCMEEIAARGPHDELEHVADGLARIFLTGTPPTVPMGLVALDRLGISPGNLCVIGARTGVGKTVALCTATLAALRRGWQVLYLTLEMTPLEIRRRLLSGYSGVPIYDLTSGASRDVGDAASRLAAEHLWIADASDQPGRRNVTAIGSLVRRFAARYADRPSVAMLDYLQLVQPSQRYQNRVEQLGDVCRELKAAALGSALPLLCAAQVSRAAEQRPGGKPQLSDLRESGEIEQVADQVVLIHRDGEQATLRVAKNRHGECFKTAARFDGARCLFVESEAIADAWGDR